MRIECKDFDRILERWQADEMAALAAHAETCAACRQQLQIEGEISAAARAMRKTWDSPHLWPRIARALEAEAQRAAKRPWRALDSLLQGLMAHWQLAATAAAAVVLTLGTWMALDRAPSGVSPAVVNDPQRILTEQALRDVEAAEATYVQSIEKLAALAEPRLQKTKSPLMLSYREKLLVLDAAIAECRAQLDQNQFNAHVRKELKALYANKQETLTQVLQEN